MSKQRYIKIHNRRAVIMQEGWKPNSKDDAFPYPGRGDTDKAQWLACFYDDAKMPDGRPAPFGMTLLTNPDYGALDVAPDAIRLVRESGQLDMAKVGGFKLYDLETGEEHDVSHIRFYV